MSKNERDFEKNLEKAQQLNLTSPPDAEKMLRKLLNQILTEIEKIKVQIELGRSLNKQGKHEEAQQFYEEAYTRARNQEFKYQKADALEGLATIDHDLGNIERGLERSQQALEIFQKLGNKLKETQATNTIARLHYTRGDLQKALKWFDRTLQLAKETKNDLDSLRALNNIANIYSSRGDFEDAAEYYAKSVELAEKLNYTHAMCITRSNLAEVQAFMGDYIESHK
ncbi:MAG: tetratricopeptide repeat protein, partial [Candidatus Hodarchaeota archaeon]